MRIHALLLPLALLVCSACFVDRVSHVYGSPYGRTHRGRLIAWPADEDGRRFRFVVDREEEGLLETSVRELERQADGTFSPEPDPPVDSAIVFLPPSPTASLRREADRLLRWAVAAEADVDTHVVVGTRSWGDVRTVRALEVRLEALAARGRANIHSGFMQALVQGMAHSVLSSLTSTIVVPLRSERDLFAMIRVRGDAWLNDAPPDALRTFVTDAAGVLLEVEALPRNGLRSLVPVSVPPAIHLLLARDASRETRERSSRLALELSRRRPAGDEGDPFIVTMRSTPVPQAELTDAAAVERLLREGRLDPLGASLGIALKARSKTESDPSAGTQRQRQ